jgi:signal transduction histidine kinase
MEISLRERRRLERDLHDGAQQRLVALSLQIGMAQKMIADKPALAGRLLDSAREELRVALGELRELARGIHPAILTDRGLRPALEALAARTPIPVDLAAMPSERLPPSIEAAAYFVVAESLTNVTKYAHAERASVHIARDNGFAVVEVRDDGVGGADPQIGTGLRGLADRVAALDGRLEVLSPPGEGTIVRANIPCASS